MKKNCFPAMIAVLLLLYTNVLQAQTTQTKLNQIELMNQFTGIWKSEKDDTTDIIEDKLFGDGHELFMKTETKGKIIWEGKSIIGYNKKNDMLIESLLERWIPNNTFLTIWSVRFLSTNKFEEILLDEISNPEKATEKWIYELKSPDLMISTWMNNNKVVSVYTFNRVK
jgi:hypothetical protein